MKQSIKQQPVLTAGVTVGSIYLILVLLFEALASYGVVITPQLQVFISAAVSLILPIAAAFITRRYTTWWNEANPLVNFEPEQGIVP
jgi:preprotein translocase subunit Sec61beta